jgi:hypothetical protein
LHVLILKKKRIFIFPYIFLYSSLFLSQGCNNISYLFEDILVHPVVLEGCFPLYIVFAPPKFHGLFGCKFKSSSFSRFPSIFWWSSIVYSSFTTVKRFLVLGLVAHACNPTYSEGRSWEHNDSR